MDLGGDPCSQSSSGSYGTTDVLSPSRKLNWCQKRIKDIFKKKTLFKRVPCLQWLPKYTIKDFVADFIAGMTVGVTVIPQALAYATVAGLPPQYGLYSAFMGCFVYVLFGSTKAVTIGPTALLGLLTHDIAVQMGPEAAILLTFLSGCIVLTMGLFNFGFLIEFIAAPVIAGFSTAAALTIATTQIKSLLGLHLDADGFVATWIAVFNHIKETQLWDTIMGLSCVVVLLVLRKVGTIKIGTKGKRTIYQKIANKSIWFVSTARNALVILICSVIAALLATQSADSGGLELTGNITSGLPSFQPPSFNIQYGNRTYEFAEICQNFGSALFIVPLIGILESVAIAKSFAKGQKVDASQEMIAIGLSNMLGSFTSSFPVTGSFSRTAVNQASGVRTPMNGIFTGALVILATSVMTPYFYFIPKSCLAAVIITAVIFMVEIHLVKLVWRTRKLDLIPSCTTFVTCLFFSLEYGILIGTAVNLAILLYSTSRPRIIIQNIHGIRHNHLLVMPDRSLVFTAMDYFMHTVRKASSHHREPPLPILFDLRHVSIADFSTAHGFHLLSEDLSKKGHQVIVSRVKPNVLSTLMGVKPKFLVYKEEKDIELYIEEHRSDS